MEEVEWRDIPYGSLYKISSNGEIMNKVKNRPISKYKTVYGYEMVVLSVNGVLKSKYVHRLLIESFMPEKLTKPNVRIVHLDGDKSNNKLSNLLVMNKVEAKDHLNALQFTNKLLCTLNKMERRYDIDKELLDKYRDIIKHSITNE